MTTHTATQEKSRISVRTITMVAMLGAIAIVLRQLEFNVPLMPSFMKMDFGELPALIGSFSLGPAAGAAICFIKEGFSLFFTKTAGVGELCDLVLGLGLVIPAGLIYKRKKDKKHALIGAVVGTIITCVIGIFVNYFVTFPMYSTLYGLPTEVIVGMYQKINPSVDGLLQCILTFNLPFSLVKRIIVALITMLVYKRLSPILKGTHETR